MYHSGKHQLCTRLQKAHLSCIRNSKEVSKTIELFCDPLARYVDNTATVSAFFDELYTILESVPSSVHIDVHNSKILFNGNVRLSTNVRHNTCVVYQNVQLTILFLYLLKERTNFFMLGYIYLNVLAVVFFGDSRTSLLISATENDLKNVRKY